MTRIYKNFCLTGIVNSCITICSYLYRDGTDYLSSFTLICVELFLFSNSNMSFIYLYILYREVNVIHRII
jgi:hypothetical protein